jgi:hypothetical protein
MQVGKSRDFRVGGGDMSETPDDKEALEGAPAADTSADAARRETLRRLGVYGALIAPALLTALTSTASAQVIVESGATN